MNISPQSRRLNSIRYSILLLIGLAGSAASSFSQSFFSAQWEVAEPTESFRNTVGTGFGGSLSYIHFISPRIAITGRTGYVKWGPRVDAAPFTDFKLVSVPVVLGFDLLFTRGIVAPYVGVTTGVDYLRIRGVSPGDPAGPYQDKSELRFSVSPHLGVGIHVAGPVGVLLTGSYKVLFTDPVSKLFTLNAGLIVGL